MTGATAGAAAGATAPRPAPVPEFESAAQPAPEPAAAPIVEPAAAASGDALDPGPTATGTGGIAAAGVAPAGVAPGAAVPAGLIPGAYLPPSSIHRPEPPPPPVAQMPLAASPAVGAPPPTPESSWVPSQPAPAPATPVAVRAGRPSLLADLPFDAPDTLAEWLVAVGSGGAAISFLLPWISGTVSYDTSWGLASASRLPILGLLAVTAVLGILPNGVAPWVRSGVLGLVGGALQLGIVWPIVAGDFGDAAFGAIVGAAAATVLIVGGIVAVAPRNAAAQPG
ncbi:MAG: hypothetical protein HY264_11775 [Chloroflexi bacterium]|nr:hypothetical protein [Chloroflexota bacterium]